MNITLEEVSYSNDSNTILILSISFTLMILSYISIYIIYCRNYNDNNDNNDNNNKSKYKKYDYEPLFNNYGTTNKESNFV